MIFHTILNNKSTIYSDWLEQNIYCLSDSTFVIPDEYQYELVQVTKKYIARPDLLVSDIYGDSTYSDVICKLNGISNPFELNEGMILVIPSPDCIMDFIYNPNEKESDSRLLNNPVKPKAKNKNESRKANEAIISDTRFKIDRNNGVVIY